MTSTTFFIIFVPILSFILLAVNLLLSTHNPYQEKNSPFECGFHSFLYQNRTQFSVSFFIFGILFLLFDLEIVLIFPYSVSAYNNNIYGLCIMIIFFVLLTLGFVFELGKNALFIDSRQVIIISTNNKDKLIIFDNSFFQSTFLKSGLPYFDPTRTIVFFRHKEGMPSSNPFNRLNSHLSFTGPCETTFIVGMMHPNSDGHVNEFHLKEGEIKNTNLGRLTIVEGKPVFLDFKKETQVQNESSVQQIAQAPKESDQQPTSQADQQDNSNHGNVNCDSPKAWEFFFNSNITLLESISTWLLDIVEFITIFYLVMDFPIFFILKLLFQYRILLIHLYYDFKDYRILLINFYNDFKSYISNITVDNPPKPYTFTNSPLKSGIGDNPQQIADKNEKDQAMIETFKEINARMESIKDISAKVDKKLELTPMDNKRVNAALLGELEETEEERMNEASDEEIKNPPRTVDLDIQIRLNKGLIDKHERDIEKRNNGEPSDNEIGNSDSEPGNEDNFIYPLIDVPVLRIISIVLCAKKTLLPFYYGNYLAFVYKIKNIINEVNNSSKKYFPIFILLFIIIIGFLLMFLI